MTDILFQLTPYGLGKLAILVALHIFIPNTGNTVIGMTTFTFSDGAIFEFVDKSGVVDQWTCHGNTFKSCIQHSVDGLYRIDTTYQD